MDESNPANSMITDTGTDPSPSTFVDADVPNTETERTVAEVWAEVLGFDQFGRNDDFFDVGGHSVLATQVAARLRVAFGRDIPERALFDWPTVATLANAVPEYPVSDEGTQVPMSRRRTSDVN